MRRDFTALIRNVAAASLLWAAFCHTALATGSEPGAIEQVDPARCFAAITANDGDKITAECGSLIDNEKTAKADRIKALIARAGVFTAKDLIDRAIADYDLVLQFDPSLADIRNTRGELWWKKGDRPKALADFGAALKLNPNQEAAKKNFKSLAQELERLGALMAVRDATKDGSRAGRAMQREQDEFLAHRDAAFGRPDYDLQKAMRERLDHLLAIEQH
jgi:tetratricopeptide (TPR) repeat protein